MRSLPVLLVLLATFFLYARTLSYRFVYDDNSQILDNTHVLSWRYLPVYFTQNVWSQVPTGKIRINLYRPLFLVWLRINMAVAGREPWGWHLTTLLLHVLATGLVYLLASTVLQDRLAAVVAAAVFGFHPIHVESVAWISGVTEPLGTSLLLGAFLCYLRQRTRPAMLSIWMALSLILFVAAMLSKETEVVLPFLIILYELTVGRVSRQPRWGVRLIPYFVLLAAYFGLRAAALHGALTRGQASLHDVLLSLPWLAYVYLKMLFWPASQSPVYDFPYVNNALSARFFIALALIAFCLGLVWLTRKRYSQLGTFLAGWFALTLAPALGIFYVAHKSDSYHDRYLYLPSLALALAIALFFHVLRLRPGAVARGVAWGVTAVLLGAMALITYHEQQYWATDRLLFEHACAVAPQNEVALANYAKELLDNQEYSRALSLSERMMKIHPESTMSFQGGAVAAFLLHNYALAERYSATAVALDPSVWQMHLQLAVCRVNLGKYEAALEPFRAASHLAPNHEIIHYKLGIVLMKLGRWPEARDEFVKELEIRHEDVSATSALAEAEAHLHAKTPPTKDSRTLSSSTTNLN
jgi:tetratricopeptide (TPR) repeat protein